MSLPNRTNQRERLAKELKRRAKKEEIFCNPVGVDPDGEIDGDSQN